MTLNLIQGQGERKQNLRILPHKGLDQLDGIRNVTETYWSGRLYTLLTMFDQCSRDRTLLR